MKENRCRHHILLDGRIGARLLWSALLAGVRAIKTQTVGLSQDEAPITLLQRAVVKKT